LRVALQSTFDGSPTRIEVSFQHESPGRGSPTRRVVALAMSRLPEADPPSVLLVGRDMTSEREMRVRLMESDRLAAVGELVAGVAHEVNNPLSSISAFAQLLLRDGGLTAAQRDSIEVIKSETLRASQVVKDLLAFARRSEPQREPLDLNGVVQRTLRLRGYQLTSNKINIETDLTTELPAVVGDARQLQQVCLNLVTNAIQAMAALGAGGTLFVSTRRDGPHVVLEMRDTGPGIPEAAKAHIFEPFFTTKGEGEGTGLGLSVSYGIVTAHGGKIEVPHTSNAGTTFRVTLPAAPEQTADEQGRDSGGLSLRSPLSGIRLLFIDDEATLRSGVQAFGELRGFTVVTACDGIEGLDMVRKEAVDAIVCDLRMPGMDGPAFHERLRRERPGLAARTVFITGDVVTTNRSSPIRQPILTKPFAFEKLEETLVSLMRGGIAASAPAGWP
jgi:two-component system, NtrC family, sensor kinase